MCDLRSDSVLRIELPPAAGRTAARSRADADLAHRSVGAALDAVLGELGAAVDEHDLVDAALVELLDAVGRAGSLDAAVVDDPGGAVVLRLCHDGPALQLDVDALDLVRAAFPLLHRDAGRTQAVRPQPDTTADGTRTRAGADGPSEVSEPRGPHYRRSPDLLMHLDVPADVARLRAARLVVRRAMPELEVEEASLFYGAMTEILTNAIEAHQRLGRTSPVRVELTAAAPRHIVVIDHGGGFDAAAVASGAGRGLAIARAVCPGLEVHHTETGTAVVLPFPDGSR